MAKIHLVKQGDHLSALAEEHGFADFRTIADHPENAALTARRDPHTLFPGDTVFIPDAIQRVEVRPTNASHTFQTDIPKLFLRVRLMDVDNVALKDTACDLTVPPDSDASLETTDSKGVLEKQIGRAREQLSQIQAHVKIKTPPPEGPAERSVTYDLIIGNLNPHSKLSGQQARLANLGYFAGYALRDLDALLWAAEEFRCDHVGKRIKGRPPIRPAPPGGEDNPDTENADKPTGIVAADLVAKLRQVHGI